MAEPTIKDAVDRARATGIDPKLIALGLRQHFGLDDEDFANLKVTTPIREALQTAANRRAAKAVSAPLIAPKREPEPTASISAATGPAPSTPESRRAELARLPQATIEAPARVAGAGVGFVAGQPAYRTHNLQSGLPSNDSDLEDLPDRPAPPHIAVAAHGVDTLVTDRNKPGVSSALNASNDAADTIGMPIHLLTNLLGMTPHGHENDPEPPADESSLLHRAEKAWPNPLLHAAKKSLTGIKHAFSAGEEFGAETAGGLIGGTAGLAKNLATRPLDTFNAMPLTTALAVAAPLEAGAKGLVGKGVKMGGKLGKAAELSGEFLRGNQPAKMQMESVTPKPAREHLLQNPEAAKAYDVFRQEVAAKNLLPAEATALLEEIFPSREKIVSTPEPAPSKGVLLARKAGTAAKGAVVGNQLAGPAGGILGAVVPELTRVAFGKLSPSAQAFVKQLFIRSTEQPTPAETARAETIVNQPHRQAEAVRAGWREAGGHVNAEGMPGVDTKFKQKRDEPLTGRHQMTMDGELRLAPDLAEKSQSIADDARGLDYEHRALNKAQGQIAGKAAIEPDPAEAARMQFAADDLAARASGPAPFTGAKEQLAELAGGRTKAGEPTLPVTNQTIDQRAGILNEPGKETAHTRSPNSKFNEKIDNVNREINRDIGDSKGAVGNEETGREMLEATRAGSLQMYREPRWRGVVQKQILEQTGLDPKDPAYKTAQKSLDDLMVKIAEDSQSTKKWKNAEIELPSGQKIDLRSASADAHRQLAVKNPALLQEITQGTFNKIGDVQATQTHELQLANRIDKESKRFGAKSPENSANYDWIGPILKATESGETVPLALRGNVAEIAKRMVDTPDVYAIKYGVTPERVTAIGKHLQEMEAVPVGTKLHTFMRNAAANGDVESAGGPLHVTKSFHRTLKAEADTIQSVAEVENLWQKFNRKGKLGVTALSIPAHVNNELSNVATRSVATGQSPTALAGQLHDIAVKIHDFYNPQKGAAMPVLERSRMRGMASLGIATDNELQGSAAHYFKQAPGVNPVAGAYGKFSAAAGEVYTKFGDALFKARDVYDGMTKLGDDLGVLKSGEHMTLDVALGRTIQIVSDGNGNFTIKHSNSTSKPLKLSDQGLQNLLARSAQMDANARYIGHQSQALIVNSLRKHLPSASPFFSWQYGAMDLPGKPGMLSAMMGFDGSPRYSTNSLTLNGIRFDRAAELAARRLAFNQMGMATLAQNRDEMGGLSGYSARTPHMMEIAYSTNPAGQTVETSHSWASGDPLGPSDLLWRAAAGGASFFATDAMRADKNSEIGKLWRLRKSGALFEPEDALRLMGASGSFLEPYYMELQKAKDNNKNPNYFALAMKATAQILGGSPTAVIDIEEGMRDPTSPLTTRRLLKKTDGGGKEEEKFLDMTFRRMMGLGWDSAVLKGKGDWYIDKTRDELNKMVGTLEAKRKEYYEVKDPRAAGIVKEKQMMQRLVNQICNEARANLRAAEAKSYRQAQIKPAQSDTGGSR